MSLLSFVVINEDNAPTRFAQRLEAASGSWFTDLSRNIGADCVSSFSTSTESLPAEKSAARVHTALNVFSVFVLFVWFLLVFCFCFLAGLMSHSDVGAE